VIEVDRADGPDPLRFDVTVREGSDESHHQVTVERATLDELAPDAEPEAVIEASFEFLLDREPKEQILPSFDLQVIERYFPEYTDELDGYL
jgi:hypothetical protein